MSCLLGENLILPQLKLFTPTLTFRTVKGSKIKKETPPIVRPVQFKNCCLCQDVNAPCIHLMPELRITVYYVRQLDFAS